MVFTTLLYEEMQNSYEIKTKKPLEGFEKKSSAPTSNTKTQF